MTYKEAYNKIIQAYFKDEIKILSPKFCFCGTLSPDEDWMEEFSHREFGYPYLVSEYGRMERALFIPFKEIEYVGIADVKHDIDISYDYPEISIKNYEEKLFEGMRAALEVLKQIHLDRGEIIDEGLNLTKRNKNILADIII